MMSPAPLMDSMDETNRSLAVEPLLVTPVVGQPVGARQRLDSVDWLRGIIMVVMVLDHARDFLGTGEFNPRDVNNTPLFLTRWITHFCAPTFVFLAGVSAYLYGARGRSRSQLSWFLLTRGFWLVFMEVSIVRFAWSFSLPGGVFVLQVIWVIGVSLACLSALVYLPRAAIVVVAVAMIASHNLLDHFSAEKMGSVGWLWMLLHERGIASPGGNITLMVIYPLVPWIGVLAAGYCVGPAIQAAPQVRRRWTLALGIGLTGLFVLLRATNLYGDPQGWAAQPTSSATVLSFLNCEKYPPSLLFLCMTLGPSLLLLNAADGFKGVVASTVITFGRVPFLFYVVHIALLHLMAVAWAQLHDGNSAWLFDVRPITGKPAAYGLDLPVVYLLWLTSVVTLYPLCRWFAGVKQRRRDWWLSYL